MSPIYKTKFGFHIDLSKILTISDVEFEDRMGHGGYYIVSIITCQLQDQPMILRENLRNWDEDTRATWRTNRQSIAMIDSINDLIDTWKKYNEKV